MNHIDKSAGPPKKTRRQGTPGSSSHETSRPDRFAVTLDAKTGTIIQIEGIDATGARHELSKDEKAELARDNGRAGLEQLLEQAFEAGIACVLGGEDEAVGAREPKEEADLRRILLKPLIDESPAARLMRRDVLDRAIVETLIHHSLKPRSKSSEGGPPKEPGPDRAAPQPTR
ncbi:hypothetical protein [Microvirga mediterraneensis]|uniref:Uncharacterized protein n=1 Tax=Microvirga mediterraneensis TaxID=2754695 RepID=A0A838BN35_9HYPH|nr:hypothetical protein [Microvirga mediterraneensis]MBA1156830.1 hypothetical protein [Microvirga mediterraneensis]